jgi:hypothetical protein
MTILGFVWRCSRGYRLCPWRSPYWRWRLETYSGVSASSIGFRVFCRMIWRERRNFLRYLGWVHRMNSMHTAPRGFRVGV